LAATTERGAWAYAVSRPFIPRQRAMMIRKRMLELTAARKHAADLQRFESMRRRPR
jgi:hypothetical protein